MSDEFWKVDEIEVTVSGFFTTHHVFHAGDERWGEMTVPAFAQGAVFTAHDGRQLHMEKPRWLGTAHQLTEGETVRGAADRRKMLSRDIMVLFEDKEYELVPEGVFKMGWFLLDANGNTLLEVQPRGAFRQGAILTLHSWIDADLVAFVYYLVHVRRQEDAAAVAASSAATS